MATHLSHNFSISPVDVEARQKLAMRVGDTVRVYLKIEEKGKIRLQVFEGLVIARKHGNEAGGTFTVRKVASGVGVEKVFPIYSPVIDHIDIVRRVKARRSKLYFVRNKAVKKLSKKFKQLRDFVGVSSVDLRAPEPAPEVEEAPAETTE